MLLNQYLPAQVQQGLEADLSSIFCRRQVALWLLAWLPWLAQPGHAAPAPPLAPFPFYSAEHALRGVYSHHLPALTQRFSDDASALVSATEQVCQALPTLPASVTAQHAAWTALHAQWQQTMVAWEALSTPALGPVLARRSQRQIDFWPTRPELINKALAKAPQTLADMERVGTLAKGLPAMELLLMQWQPMVPGAGQKFDGRAPKPGKPLPQQAHGSTTMPAATCQYLSLVAQGVQTEAQELGGELATWASQDWAQTSEATPERTAAALSEWLNQWLGGVERLRWMHIEKPVRAVQGVGHAVKGHAPHFARLSRAANLAGWRAQWASLKAQGQLGPAQRQLPPVPGKALVPIEALLLGKGHITLAQRWAQAMDRVSTHLDKLPALAPSRAQDQRDLLAVADALKAVTQLYQTEVASALDIALGFSDADGD
jgi:predicted lipoprotein